MLLAGLGSKIAEFENILGLWEHYSAEYECTEDSLNVLERSTHELLSHPGDCNAEHLQKCQVKISSMTVHHVITNI